jgi:protein-disulfide isomerase
MEEQKSSAQDDVEGQKSSAQDDMEERPSSAQDDVEKASVEPQRPSSALRLYVLSAGAAAGVVLFAAAFFVLGFLTHAVMDDDDGSTASAATTSPGSSAGGSTPGGESSAAQPTPQPVVAASVDDDPYLGPVDAPVTIIEFSDYQCPFCKRFRDETLDQVLETYEGKIKFVYRDFPISSIHAWAQKAGEAGECADDQGKFWEYHDLIFEDQTTLNSTLQTAGLTGVVDTFKSYAADLGLDTAAFNECLDSGKYTSEVQKDYQDGQAYGVTGTPGFFINGVEVKGAQPFSAFQQVIDAALAEAE